MSIVRKMLTFAITAIALMALLYVHIQFPASEVTKLPDKLPTVHFLNYIGFSLFLLVMTFVLLLMETVSHRTKWILKIHIPEIS